MFNSLKKWWTLDAAEEAKTSDSVHEPLPDNKRRKTLPLLILGFTWGFLITGLLIGGDLGANISFTGGVIPAMIIGCLALFIIAVLTGMVGYKIGGTNDMAFQFAFGKKGRWMPAAFLLIVVMGFQGIIVGGTATIWLNSTDHPYFFLTALIFGALFTLTCYIGIDAIEKLSNPAMVVLLGVAVFAIIFNISSAGGWSGFQTLSNAIGNENETMTMATAINLVIGSWIAGSVLTSDFTRFAKNKWAAIGMLGICFMLTQFLLLALGATGSVVFGTYDFTQYLSDFSPILGVIALITMTIAMWTTANTNLYLPAAQVAAITKRPFKVAVIICGSIGTLLGAFGFFEQFQSFINWIGAIIPPLVGPMIIDFWLIHRTNYKAEKLKELPDFNPPAILAASTGLVFTVASVGIPFIGLAPVGFLVQPWIVPAIFGAVVSSISYIIYYYIFQAFGISSGYSKTIQTEKINEGTLVPPIAANKEKNK